MSEAIILSMLLAAVAAFFNGSFFLPPKYIRGWEWENMWTVFATISQVLLPWLVAWIAIPHLGRVLHDSPWTFFLPGVIAGVAWGMGMITYGLGVAMIGMAAANAIIMGLATMTGTLGPFIVYTPEKVFSPVGFIFLLAIVLVIAGVYVYGRAGVRKEEDATHSDPELKSSHGQFRSGMLVCAVTGVLGTAFIYGFASSTNIINAAIEAGAKPLMAGYLPWAIVFSSGYTLNLSYCLYRTKQRHSAASLLHSGHFLRNTALAGLMAALWYGGVLIYGMAAAGMGRLGPSAGSGIYLSGTLVSANFLGWFSGEWKGASRSVIRGFIIGMALITAGIFVIALGVARTR